MLFESPNKLYPFNIPPPVRLSGALGGVEVLDAGVMGGLVGGELQHVLNAQAAAAAAVHHQLAAAAPPPQISAPIRAETTSSGRSTPNGQACPTASSPSPSKLFVGGLSWQTSSEKLREYFAMFGPVADVLIMKDPVTQRSRGFGFITFQEAGAVEKVLAVAVHTLDGKRIDPKHATPKCAPRPNKTKKIFVGGVGQDTTADEVRAYFAQFGHVEDAVMLMDQQTKRHRGFGFVTFHAEEAVERVCDIHFHTIKNKKVECKRAQPKEAVAAAPALGKRVVVRGGRGLVYAPAVSLPAPLSYRYAPYAPHAPAHVLPQPPHPHPYPLAGLDMSAFQGVDWAAMYPLPLYI